MHLRKPSDDETRDSSSSSSPNSVITREEQEAVELSKLDNPFGDGLRPDPICKETSEFVSSRGGLVNVSLEGRRSSVEYYKRGLEAPSTPGRPLFNFSVPRKKTIPSKWDDAEKWLKITTHHDKGDDAFEEKVSSFHSSEVFLKDKFTENVEPALLHSESTNEEETKQFAMIDRRDVGTEMTPLGSSTTTRCHTPIKIASPARHNTPTSRSGPLAINSSNSIIDISELNDCHFAVWNWSTREEEEEEVSKSLRHFEPACEERKRFADSPRAAATWEDGERTKSCIRYQREEARIQAWVNLQKAKAEARSRKLEVKIEKLRSDLEEKLMKRMTIVHRRAEEWKASAQLQHSQQVQRASEQIQKIKIQQKTHFKDPSSSSSSCGCFPCNHHL